MTRRERDALERKALRLGKRLLENSITYKKKNGHEIWAAESPIGDARKNLIRLYILSYQDDALLRRFIKGFSKEDREAYLRYRKSDDAGKIKEIQALLKKRKFERGKATRDGDQFMIDIMSKKIKDAEDAIEAINNKVKASETASAIEAAEAEVERAEEGGGDGADTYTGGGNVTGLCPPAWPELASKVPAGFRKVIDCNETSGKHGCAARYRQRNAGSQAYGRYQFIPKTGRWVAKQVGTVWRNGHGKSGKGVSPVIQDKMFYKFIEGNIRTIKGLGLTPDPWNLWVAHNLGPGNVAWIVKGGPWRKVPKAPGHIKGNLGKKDKAKFDKIRRDSGLNAAMKWGKLRYVAIYKRKINKCLGGSGYQSKDTGATSPVTGAPTTSSSSSSSGPSTFKKSKYTTKDKDYGGLGKYSILDGSKGFAWAKEGLVKEVNAGYDPDWEKVWKFPTERARTEYIYLHSGFKDRLRILAEYWAKNHNGVLTFLDGKIKMADGIKDWDAAIKKYGSEAKAKKHAHKPGESIYYFGLAANIGPKSGGNHPLTVMEKAGLLKKNKLYRPFPTKEPWRVQPIEVKGMAAAGVPAAEGQQTPPSATPTVSSPVSPKSKAGGALALAIQAHLNGNTDNSVKKKDQTKESEAPTVNAQGETSAGEATSTVPLKETVAINGSPVERNVTKQRPKK